MHSAPVESLLEFADTVRDISVSGVARYRQIFREERFTRTVDLLAFMSIHTFVFIPLAALWLQARQPAGVSLWVFGAVWTVISYPFCYVDESRSGLLKLSVADYLKTRALALVGSWMVLVAIPIFIMYSLRWILVPLFVILIVRACFI